jgi:hypothetical protein
VDRTRRGRDKGRKGHGEESTRGGNNKERKGQGENIIRGGKEKEETTRWGKVKEKKADGGENSGKKDWEEKRSEEKRKTVTEREGDRGRKEKCKDRSKN